MGGVQMLARVETPAFAAQRFPEKQVRAGLFGRERTVGQLVDRLQKELLGLPARRGQGPRPRLDAARPFGPGPPGYAH